MEEDVEEWYICKYCRKNFPGKDKLNAHKRQEHFKQILSGRSGTIRGKRAGSTTNSDESNVKRRRADTDSEKSSCQEASVDVSSKSHVNEVPSDGDGADPTGQPSSSNSRKVPTVKILPQTKPSSVSTFGTAEKNVNELQKVVTTSEPTSVIAYAAVEKSASDKPNPKCSGGQEGEDIVVVEKVIKRTDGIKANFSAPDGGGSTSVKVDEPLIIVLKESPGKNTEDSRLQKIQTLEKQLEEKRKYLSSCQEQMKRDELQLENALYCLKKLREQTQEEPQVEVSSAKPTAEIPVNPSEEPIVFETPSETSQPRLVLNASERSELLITGPIPKARVEYASQQKQQPLKTESPQQPKISVQQPPAHPPARIPAPLKPASSKTVFKTLGPLDWRVKNLLASRSELQAFPVTLNPRPEQSSTVSSTATQPLSGAVSGRKPETTVRVSLGSRGGSRTYSPVLTARTAVPSEVKTMSQPSQTQQAKPPMAIRGGGRGRSRRGTGSGRGTSRSARGACQSTASTYAVLTGTKDLPVDAVPRTEFNCGACGTIFYDANEMQTHECVGHVAVIHTKTVGSVIANLTESAFRSVSKTHNVQLNTSPPKQFSCASCCLDFDSELNLESHNDYVHRINTLQTFACEICGKIYTQKSGLLVHRATHKAQEMLTTSQRSQPDVQKGIRNFVCAICDAAFCTNTALEKHKIGHQTPIAAPARFQCFTCKQGFDSAIALDEHILNHERFEKLLNQFTKSDSGNTTTQSADPDVEILDVVPPKSTSSSSGSESTTQNVNKAEESPILCYICSKSFKSLEEVNKHVVSHIDESLQEQRAQVKEAHQLIATTDSGNEIPCSMCSKAFRDQNTLEIHVKAEHSKRTIFPCPLCGIGFPYEKALILHCAFTHSKNSKQ